MFLFSLLSPACIFLNSQRVLRYSCCSVLFFVTHEIIGHLFTVSATYAISSGPWLASGDGSDPSSAVPPDSSTGCSGLRCRKACVFFFSFLNVCGVPFFPSSQPCLLLQGWWLRTYRSIGRDGSQRYADGTAGPWAPGLLSSNSWLVTSTWDETRGSAVSLNLSGAIRLRCRNIAGRSRYRSSRHT